MKLAFISFTILAGVAGEAECHQLAASFWVLSVAFALACLGEYLDGPIQTQEEDDTEEEQP